MNRAQRRAQGKHPTRDFVVDYSWRMILAAAGLVLHDQGMDDDAVGDFIIAVQQRITDEVNAGINAAAIVDKLEDATGIVLVRGGGQH